MATNFGADATSIPELQSATPVLEGVVTPSISGKQINDIFSNIGDMISGNKASKADKVISDFTEKQLMVATALDQGSIPNSAYARTLTRKNLLDAIHENPSLASDLMKAQSALVNLTGGGDIIKDGSEEEQRWNSRKDALVTSGVVDATASDSEFKAADLTQRQLVVLKEQHDLKMQTIDEQLKDMSLSDAKRTQLKHDKEDDSFQLAKQIGPSELTKFKNDVSKIADGPGTGAEKQQAIEEYWAQFLSDGQSLALDLTTEDANMFKKPFEVLKDTFIKKATGVYTEEDTKRQIDVSLNTQKLIAIADPEVARYLAITDMVKDPIVLASITTQTGPVAKKIMNFMAYGTTTSTASEQPSPYSQTSQDKVAVKSYLENTTRIFNEGGEGSKEARGRIERTLSSVKDYQGLVETDPKGAIEVVNWLASPGFAKAMANDPTLKDKADAAKEALKRNYSDEVWGMINKQFTENKVSNILVNKDEIKNRGDVVTKGKGDTPTTDLVTTQATASGMEFVPIDPASQAAKDKAKQLNTDLKPIINTNLRAWAHLDGRTDYGKYWEESSSTFLNTDVGKNTGGELSTDDFKKLAALTAEFQPLQAAVDKTESGGSYDTLLAHSEKSGGSFAGVKVSSMSISEAVDFSNGDYAQFSKDTVGRKATPMGRYQIVGTTLAQIAKEMGLNLDTTFNADTQDAMFAHLVNKAVNSASTLAGKRGALRGVWEGFKNLSNAELDAAIEHFEG